MYARLPFCWSWLEGWDIFRKDGAAENEGIDFEIGDIGTSALLYWSFAKI